MAGPAEFQRREHLGRRNRDPYRRKSDYGQDAQIPTADGQGGRKRRHTKKTVDGKLQMPR
jgi:hypothetical protein